MEENKCETPEEEVVPPTEEETVPEAGEEETAAEGKGSKKVLRELLETQKRLNAAEEALAAAKDAAKEQNDKYLRLAAEYDNFRRRAAAEKQAAYTDGLEGALEKLLPILDNLERAALYSDGEKVAEGIAMTAKAAAEALAALGVEAFGDVGETFDPGLHNAVMHTEEEDRGEGEIAAVHQKGYRKGERILRYAMVTVAN